MSHDRPFLARDYPTLVERLLDDLATGETGRTALTDTTEGSVVRTLVEAFGRELAGAYEQLEHVYRHGYFDTAEGVALDHVVALLGFDRHRSGSTEGRVIFRRSTPAPEDVPIPEGTLVAGKDVPTVETMLPGVLSEGALQVSVPVRSVEPSQDRVEPGALTVMPSPILGIEGVSNPAALLPRRAEETDDELRARVRRSQERVASGAVSAIERAVASMGLEDVLVREHLPERPGEVDVLVGDPDAPRRLDEIRTAVREVRPAGVHVVVHAAEQVAVRVVAHLEVEAMPSEADRRAIESELTRRVAAYVDRLRPNENVRLAKVRSLLGSHDAVLGLVELGRPPVLTPLSSDGADLSETHRAPSGDVRVGMASPFERARIDLDAYPPELHFEPAELDVFVDVEAELAAGLTPQVIDGLRTALEEALAATPAGIEIGFERWASAVAGPEVRSIRFTITHDRDGRVVQLGPESSAVDVFEAREALRLVWARTS